MTKCTTSSFCLICHHLVTLSPQLRDEKDIRHPHPSWLQSCCSLRKESSNTLQPLSGLQEMSDTFGVEWYFNTHKHAHSSEDDALFKYVFFGIVNSYLSATVNTAHAHTRASWGNVQPVFELHLLIMQPYGADVTCSVFIRACALAYPCSKSTCFHGYTMKLYGHSCNARKVVCTWSNTTSVISSSKLSRKVPVNHTWFTTVLLSNTF